MEPKGRLEIRPSDPLMEQAISALKLYRDAESAGRPNEEIERLRRSAEFSFQAISDWNLWTLRRETPEKVN